MKIEKQTSYKCELTKEEDEVLDAATIILNDLLENMHDLQCTYADCTQYPEMLDRLSFENIEDAKNILCRLLYLNKIYGGDKREI